jgi:hypothetical protein
VGRTDHTDDRGIYRIYGLPPGDYYLQVRAARFPGKSTTPVPTYYPTASDLASAQRVSVGIGAEVGGIDVVLTQVEAARITGRVVDAAGRPQVRARSVSLLSRDPAGLDVRGGTIQPDGSFTIEGVPAGAYVLYANTPAVGGPVEFAVTELRTMGDDIEYLVLRTSAGTIATGTLVFDRGVVPPFGPEDLYLFTMPLGFVDVPVGRGTGGVNPDWSFEIRGMGDAQLLRLLGLPDGWALDSVLLNGRNITDQPVHLPAGRTTTGFRIVVTDRTTRVLGTVVDTAGRPVTDCTVVIFAADATRWQFPSRFVHAVRPDQHGTIDVPDLPTERYLAFAATGIPEGAWTDTRFLERIRSTATGFTLGAGETHSISITVRALP